MELEIVEVLGTSGVTGFRAQIRSWQYALPTPEGLIILCGMSPTLCTLAVPLESCALGPSLCSVFSVCRLPLKDLPSRPQESLVKTHWLIRSQDQPWASHWGRKVGDRLVPGQGQHLLQNPLNEEGRRRESGVVNRVGYDKASSALLILHPFLWGIIVVENVGYGARWLWFWYWLCHLRAVWPWAS